MFMQQDRNLRLRDPRFSDMIRLVYMASVRVMSPIGAHAKEFLTGRRFPLRFPPSRAAFRAAAIVLGFYGRNEAPIGVAESSGVIQKPCFRVRRGVGANAYARRSHTGNSEVDFKHFHD